MVEHWIVFFLKVLPQMPQPNMQEQFSIKGLKNILATPVIIF